VSITDPEVKVLAALSQAMMVDYSSDDARWAGSPFDWIRGRPPRQKGAIAEKLVAGWLATKNFNVARSPDADADRIIEGHRAEIKFSALWANDGYTFQQIRDQNYDFAVCLGVSPFTASCWVVPKAELMRQWQSGGIPSQHGGDRGTDTAWFAFPATQPPEWIRPFGGSLLDGAMSLTRITGIKPF
jgi:hypothetical protein